MVNHDPFYDKLLALGDTMPQISYDRITAFLLTPETGKQGNRETRNGEGRVSYGGVYNCRQATDCVIIIHGKSGRNPGEIQAKSGQNPT